MKKFVALFLALLLCVSMLSVAAYATGTASLSVTDKEAERGDEVTLTVSLADNPGIAGMRFEITYDATRLEAPEYAGVAIDGGTWTIDYYAVWDNAGDSTYTGDILNLTFKVKADAPDGDAEVTVTCVDACNWDLDDVAISGVTGVVTIKDSEPEHTCSAETMTKVEAKPSTCEEQGNIEYYECSCGKLYILKDGAYVEVTMEDVLLPLADHSWKTEYGMDDTHHWLICAVCGHTSEKEVHDHDIEGDDGYYYCVCGHKGDKIPAITEPEDGGDDYDDEPDTGDITIHIAFTALIVIAVLATVVALIFKRKAVK